MDFIEKLRNLSARIEQQKDLIHTEEATKNAFVMPFINLLGYDVFNPAEVVPEFTADVGVKAGEKVDYAIRKDDEVIMLIECKKYGEDLSDAYSQLYRYFSVVDDARFGVLTDGVSYRFYADLEDKHKMDSKPFLEFDMLDIQPSLVNELKRFAKETFHLDETLIAASDLKYTKEIKQIMMEQLDSPDEDFVRFFLSSVYSGLKTAPVVQEFTSIVKRALNQFMNEAINRRLQSAIAEGNAPEQSVEAIEDNPDELDDEELESPIVTTEEELEGFFTVKSIVREVVSAERIVHRDTMSYMTVVLDGSRNKQICRLYFNAATKYIGLINDEKKYDRFTIDSIDDIFNYTEQLKAIALRHVGEQQNEEPDSEQGDNSITGEAESIN